MTILHAIGAGLITVFFGILGIGFADYFGWTIEDNRMSKLWYLTPILLGIAVFLLKV